MTVSERSFCATPYGMPALVGAGCEERRIRGARSGAPRTIEQPGAIGARSVRYIASHHFDRGLMLGKGSRLMLEVRSA